MSRPATRTAAAAAAAAADPGRVRPRRLPGPGREPGDARQLHRLRLRPVPGADPEVDEHLAPELAVPRRRHLHLRRLAGLPQPAEPHPGLGRRPSSARAGGCCRSPSARRRRAARASRATTTTRRSGRSRARTALYRPARTPGLRARPTSAVAAAKALGIVPGSTLWYDLEGFDHTNRRLPRVRAGVPQRLDQPPARPRLRLRRLLQRRVRHQDPRRRPGQPAGRVHAARPDLDRPLGRQGQHQHVVHPQRRLASPAAGSSSTRAATTRPGAASRSTSTATSSTSARARWPRPSRSTAAARGSTSPTTPPLRPGTHRRPTWSRRCSACSRSRTLYAGKVNGVYNDATIAAVPTPGRAKQRLTVRRHLEPDGTG